jgi:cell fate (sporulation/competence/biofilm development) regulator YlbF (YheA/YmcA/DUF963 family)
MQAATDVRVAQDVALEAARDFAAAIAETAEYQAFDQAQVQLRQDEAAQKAIHDFQEKRQALGWQLQLGMSPDAEMQELQRLQENMLALPAVQAYVAAQQRLGSVCREAADLVSQTIGLNFAAGCGPGCACG